MRATLFEIYRTFDYGTARAAIVAEDARWGGAIASDRCRADNRGALSGKQFADFAVAFAAAVNPESFEPVRTTPDARRCHDLSPVAHAMRSIQFICSTTAMFNRIFEKPSHRIHFDGARRCLRCARRRRRWWSGRRRVLGPRAASGRATHGGGL
jgi:hypothetical protein